MRATLAPGPSPWKGEGGNTSGSAAYQVNEEAKLITHPERAFGFAQGVRPLSLLHRHPPAVLGRCCS
jgi:hypothetical protein